MCSNRILLIIVAIIWRVDCNAQQYFNNIYDFDRKMDNFLTCIRSGDYLFAVGHSFELRQSDYLDALYVSLTPNGDTIWSRRFNYSTQINGGVVAYYPILLNNGVFVINGFAYDSIEGATDIYIHALNEVGDSLWLHNLDAGYNDRPCKMLLDTDGGILLLGYYYLGDSDSSRIVIIKADTLGNKLWQKEYGQPNSYNFAYDWYKTDDGGYILAGDRNDNNNQNRNLLLIKLDSLFNEEWSQSYDGGFYEVMGGFSGLQVVNDGYIVVGQQEYFAVSTGTNRTKGIIIKTDKQGGLEWQKLYNEQFRNIGYRGIVERALNEFMVAGYVSIDSGADAKVRLLLTKFDEQGEILWQREYNHFNGNDLDHVYCHFISKDEDGNFLINGYILYPYFTTHLHDAWLMKTDSCGYTEGDVSIAQIQLDTLIDKSITLRNTSPVYCSWQWQFGDGDSSGIRNPTHTYSDTGSYTISLVTRAGNDWDTAYLVVHIGDTITAIGPQATLVKAQMRLYPNPASSFIVLSGYIPKDLTGAKVEFYDMQGRLVKTEFLKNGLINQGIPTKDFATGVYAYRVYSNEENISAGRIFIEP